MKLTKIQAIQFDDIDKTTVPAFLIESFKMDSDRSLKLEIRSFANPQKTTVFPLWLLFAEEDACLMDLKKLYKFYKRSATVEPA